MFNDKHIRKKYLQGPEDIDIFADQEPPPKLTDAQNKNYEAILTFLNQVFDDVS